MPVDVISLMKRLSVTDDILLRDEEGNYSALRPEEIDMVLHALAEHVRRTETTQ